MFTEATTAISRFKGVLPQGFENAPSMTSNIPNGTRQISIREPGNELERLTPRPLEKTQLFSILIEDHVVDSKMLNLELARHKRKGLSKRQLSAIKEGLLEDMDKDVKVKIVQLLANSETKDIFISSKSGALLDSVLIFMASSVKAGLSLACPVSHYMSQNESEAGTEWPELKLVDIEVHPEYEASQDVKMNRSFLTYLWGCSVVDVGESPFFASSPITLKGEAVGCQKIKVEGGHAIQSQEIIRALSLGKLVSSMKIMVSPELFWSQEEESTVEFSIDDDMQISGLKIPKNIYTCKSHSSKLDFFKTFFDCLNSELLNACKAIKNGACADNMRDFIFKSNQENK